MNNQKPNSSKYIADALDELRILVEGEENLDKVYADIQRLLVGKMKESFKNGIEVGKKSFLNPTRPTGYTSRYGGKSYRR